MTIPKQIEEAADLAEQLHSQMFNASEPQEEVPQEAVSEVPETPEETPSSAEPAPETPDYEKLAKDYEQKWKSLQGMYNSSQEELRSFKQSVLEKLGSVQNPAPTPEIKPEPERIAKFREEYGDDLLEAFKELIKTEIDPILQEKVKPVQEQVATVEEAQYRASQKDFMNFLDDQVKGDWRSLWDGKDPKFLEFCNQSDPSGLYTYGELIDLYNNKWDGERLAKVFNAYLGASTAEESKPPQATPPQQKPNPARESMVAPSRTTQHQSPATEEKRIWNNAMIAQFQRDDRANKYDAETSKAMWDDLLAAMSEGRIR